MTDSEDLKCTGCGADVDPLAVFPGGLCLSCYSETDAHRPITADELARMWGAK